MLNLTQTLVPCQRVVISEDSLINENSALKRSYEFLMSSSSEIQECLISVWPGDPDEYKSLMDYFFAESFTDQKEACFAYYRGEGPKLHELVSHVQLRDFDTLLMSLFTQVLIRIRS